MSDRDKVEFDAFGIPRFVNRPDIIDLMIIAQREAENAAVNDTSISTTDLARIGMRAALKVYTEKQTKS